MQADEFIRLDFDTRDAVREVFPSGEGNEQYVFFLRLKDWEDLTQRVVRL